MSTDEEELDLAYVTQLRSEHQHVKHCLGRIEQHLRSCRQGQRPADCLDELIRSLVDLREELGHHFAEEQAGGVVEEAVTHTPSLGREAADLEHENLKLLKLVDRLIDKLRAAPKSTKKIEKEYRRLVQRICEHEAEESRIIEESFGMDVD
jgi:hypothetical protein